VADKLGFLERLKLAWWTLRGKKALTVSGRLTSLSEVDIDPSDVETLVEEGYEQAEVVYACVRAIATSANDVPVRVLVKDEEKAEHPLAGVLARPWPWVSRFELLEATLTYLSVAGKAFWWKQRSKGKRVVGLYPLRADLVEIKPGKDLLNPIEAYEMTWRKSRFRFPPEDVVYFRYFDPLSDLGAFPPLAVGMDNVDADNLATKFMQYFFRRGAMLGGLLSTEQRLGDDEVDFLKEKWRQQYAGLEHWGEVAVLSHGAKYQQLGITMKEMAFPELRMLSESRICMVFGVPPIIIHSLAGLQHSTYSNFETAQKVFWTNTLSPLYGRLADRITLDLGADFGKDVGVTFAVNEAPALQENRDAAWKRAGDGVTQGWVTVNEARAEAGLPPVREGEVFLRGLATLAEEARLDGGKARVMLPATVMEKKDIGYWGLDIGEERKERHARQRDLIARAWEGRFRDRARELFGEEVKLLKAAVQEPPSSSPQGGESMRHGGERKQVAWMGVLLAVKEVVEARKGNWRDGFIPLFKALLGAQGETIAADFGIDFNLSNPLVLDWVAGYSFRFSEKLVNVTAADLGKLIGQAQAEGWSIPKLQDELQGLYDGWSRLRAELIARTETIRSSNAGARMAYRTGGVKQLQWWATMDERVCPFCGEMHKRIIGIEGSFWQQGDVMEIEGEGGKVQSLKFDYEQVDHPPLHPDCRCTVLPVV